MPISASLAKLLCTCAASICRFTLSECVGIGEKEAKLAMGGATSSAAACSQSETVFSKSLEHFPGSLLVSNQGQQVLARLY